MDATHHCISRDDDIGRCGTQMEIPSVCEYDWTARGRLIMDTQMNITHDETYHRDSDEF